MATHQEYYVPNQSHWPIVAASGIFLTLCGLAMTLFNMQQNKDTGLSLVVFLLGSVLMAYMFFGWFATVIRESHQGLYSDQLAISFRRGMGWFIFSEVMFFAAFFGVLFYVRVLSVPWLAGEGDKGMSHMLWPDFVAQWPLLLNPDPEQFKTPKAVIDPWHIPLLNTILLVTSSFTLTFAHHALKAGNRAKLKVFMVITLALGITFLGFQVSEYIEAYQELSLTLASGVYASTFFLLTGFHGAHVTVGTIILIVVFARILKGHFSDEDHFAFEAGAWYWHFVDVVWLCLFMLVYVF
ncbi:MAG: cytochrome c oxidase subunit 3 [Moraxellaceae bacterium]|nr:MAG: cytochrome c oxidase subunit 3 [Moraxellaceae bacterium]